MTFCKTNNIDRTEHRSGPIKPSLRISSVGLSLKSNIVLLVSHRAEHSQTQGRCQEIYSRYYAPWRKEAPERLSAPLATRAPGEENRREPSICTSRLRCDAALPCLLVGPARVRLTLLHGPPLYLAALSSLFLSVLWRRCRVWGDHRLHYLLGWRSSGGAQVGRLGVEVAR